MPDKRPVIIDPSVIKELGKMYTTISQTLRELIQNGFDAYANNIWINIDISKDIIEIEDDGMGMNDYVVLNHYANVGLSTKQKTIEELPPIPLELNSKRPKIGKKGMGKLSWILIAKQQETITNSMDLDYSIKVLFDSTDLSEYDEPIHIDKQAKHGTYIKFTGLQITDITEKDLNELTDMVGFLSQAFPEFSIYLTVKSPSLNIEDKLNIENKKIVKVLAEGYEFKTRGTYKYPLKTKYDEKSGEDVVTESLDMPYDFKIRLPSIKSVEITEFWLLSGYMGVRKIEKLSKFSGYLNIDNIELVANRNNIQTTEQEKYKNIIEIIEEFFFSQLEIFLTTKDELTKLEYLSVTNQKALTMLIYYCPNSSSNARKISKHFSYMFYGIGLKKLIDFINTENVIYYYYQSTKLLADKASYYGYVCFAIDNYYDEYSVKYAFDTNFVQNITSLPKEAYASAGTTIKPAGNLQDVLKNIGKIFDSLTYSYNKLLKKQRDIERELLEKADSLTESEKIERKKELENILNTLRKLQEEVDKGKSEKGETSKQRPDISGKEKSFKKEKEKAFKQNIEHYIKMKFSNIEFEVGFAYFEDKNIIANIYNRHYIHMNLNNEYIKSAVDEKNPMHQLILLTPHICHEVTHIYSSEHDEAFQSNFNALLVPTLDNLLKTLKTEEELFTHHEVEKEKIKPIEKLKIEAPKFKIRIPERKEPVPIGNK